MNCLRTKVLGLRPKMLVRRKSGAPLYGPRVRPVLKTCLPISRRRGRHTVGGNFFAKVTPHSFCRGSFPNRNRCAGFRFGFDGISEPCPQKRTWGLYPCCSLRQDLMFSCWKTAVRAFRFRRIYNYEGK